MQQERWADAIALFKRAETLLHAPPHLLYMARAYVKLGRLVEAREAYQRILHEELSASAPKAFVDAKAAASVEEKGLAARLATLTIVVEEPPAGAKAIVVTMDGAEVARPLVGVAHPVDPGAHKVSAKAEGWSAAEVAVKLADGETQTITLKLSHPEPIVATAPTATPETPETPAADSAAPAPSSHSALRTAGWISLGVGVVGLAAGTFFVVKNRQKRSDAAALCPGTVCPAANRPAMSALDDDADSAATFSWVGYGIGAAGLVAGAAMLFFSRPSAEKSAAVTPWVGVGSAGVAGRF